MFLHGYLSDKKAFTAQIRYFSEFYRVTAIDFRGFGESDPLSEPYSVSDYAEETVETLLSLGVTFPNVVAHSFGVRVAIKAQATFERKGKTLFDKMVLTGPAGVILPRGKSYKRKVRRYRIVKKFFPKFAERNFGSKEYRSLDPVMKESYKKIVNEDLRADASEVSRPVLIVEGKEDTTTPLVEAKEYLRCFRFGELTEEEGGHFCFAQFPSPFNIKVEEFFDRV